VKRTDSGHISQSQFHPSTVTIKPALTATVHNHGVPIIVCGSGSSLTIGFR
jgi:hypothetical protein